MIVQNVSILATKPFAFDDVVGTTVWYQDGHADYPRKDNVEVQKISVMDSNLGNVLVGINQYPKKVRLTQKPNGNKLRLENIELV